MFVGEDTIYSLGGRSHGFFGILIQYPTVPGMYGGGLLRTGNDPSLTSGQFFVGTLVV